MVRFSGIRLGISFWTGMLFQDHQNVNPGYSLGKIMATYNYFILFKIILIIIKTPIGVLYCFFRI